MADVFLHVLVAFSQMQIKKLNSGSWQEIII